MVRLNVEVQYVPEDGPYQCTHRGVRVRQDGMANLDKVVCDVERRHLKADSVLGGMEPLLHVSYRLQPVDQLPA